MHVGFYSPSWPPEKSANGIVTYVSQMQKYLLNAGHNVTIFTSSNAFLSTGAVLEMKSVAPLHRRIISRFTDRIYPGSKVGIGMNLGYAINEMVEKLEIDILEIEESFGWSNILKILLSVPVVTRLHGPHYLGSCEKESGIEEKESKNRKLSEYRAIRNSVAITAPSSHLLSDVTRTYAPKTKWCKAIPNPINVNDAARWSIDRCDKNTILLVGRFDLRKGADVALEGFQKLLMQQPEAKLVFVGPDAGVQLSDGVKMKFDEYSQEFLDSRTRGKIEFMGRIEPNEIKYLREKAFVTIVCSRFENFPYSVAEAMAMGCPLISSKSFHDEMIVNGETGLSFENGDSSALAAQIDWMFRNRECAASMGHAARLRAEGNYSLEIIGNETLKFYNMVLANVTK